MKSFPSKRKNQNILAKQFRFFLLMVAVLTAAVLLGESINRSIVSSEDSSYATINNNGIIAQKLDPIYVSPDYSGKAQEKPVESIKGATTYAGSCSGTDVSGWNPIFSKTTTSVDQSDLVKGRDLQGETVTITDRTTWSLYEITFPNIVWAGRTGCANESCPIQKEDNIVYAKYPNASYVMPNYSASVTPDQANQDTLKAADGSSPAIFSARVSVEGKDGEIVPISYVSRIFGKDDEFTKPSEINPDAFNKSAGNLANSILPPNYSDWGKTSAENSSLDLNSPDIELINLNDVSKVSCIGSGNLTAITQSFTKSAEEWINCSTNPASCRQTVILGIEMSSPMGTSKVCEDGKCANGATYDIVGMQSSPTSEIVNKYKDTYITTPCKILKDGWQVINVKCVYNASYVFSWYWNWATSSNPYNISNDIPTYDEYVEAVKEAWAQGESSL